jgi:hypothetical protein
MIATYVFAMIVTQQPEVVSYEYVGKVGTKNATLTIDWPKGSAHKLVPKLSGSLLMGVGKFYDAIGSNKTKGHVEFKLMKDKKSIGALRLMRDPKTPKIWIGDYYLPKQKPIPVRLKAMGEVEYGC